MGTTAGSTVLTDVMRNPDPLNDPNDKDVLSYRYVSAALTAQSISGTATIQIQGRQNRTFQNLSVAWRLYLIDAAGTPRVNGVLVDSTISVRRDTTPLVATVPIVNRGDSVTITSVSSQVGDYLVFEVGVGGWPTPGTGTLRNHNALLRFGEAGTGDLPSPDDTNTSTTLRPWLELSTSLTFYTPPTNEARVTDDSLEGLYSDMATGSILVTQDTLEGLYQNWSEGITTVTQDTLEGLYSDDVTGSTLVTQDTLEGLYDTTLIALLGVTITQDTLEGLYETEAPPVAAPVRACPEGQITFTGGTTGSIRFARSEVGQISTTHAEEGQVGCH